MKPNTEWMLFIWFLCTVRSILSVLTLVCTHSRPSITHNQLYYICICINQKYLSAPRPVTIATSHIIEWVTIHFLLTGYAYYYMCLIWLFVYYERTVIAIHFAFNTVATWCAFRWQVPTFMTCKPIGFSLTPFRAVVCVCYYETDQSVTGCVITLPNSALKYSILTCWLHFYYRPMHAVHAISFFALSTLHQHRPLPTAVTSCQAPLIFFWPPRCPLHVDGQSLCRCFCCVLLYWSWHWLTGVFVYRLLYIGVVQWVYSFVVCITVWMPRHMAVGSRGTP